MTMHMTNSLSTKHYNLIHSHYIQFKGRKKQAKRAQGRGLCEQKIVSAKICYSVIGIAVVSPNITDEALA